MATVIDGAMWTLTEAAAELLVSKDILKKCESGHIALTHEKILPIDLPVYHLSNSRDPAVGWTTLTSYINEAEKEVEGGK